MSNTMKFWITPDGSYYEGEHVAEGSIEVTERPTDYHEWIGGEWVLDSARHKGDRIALIQSAYEIDRDNLNKAWLAALIADGAEETARKTAIESQMAALDAQLETDILVVITEE